MRNGTAFYTFGAIGAVLAVVLCGTTLADEMPENLAPKAKVSASSQFSDAYRPEMAINGVVPSEFQQDGDWAVRAMQSGQFTLEWDKPIEALLKAGYRVLFVYRAG